MFSSSCNVRLPPTQIHGGLKSKTSKKFWFVNWWGKFIPKFAKEPLIPLLYVSRLPLKLHFPRCAHKIFSESDWGNQSKIFLLAMAPHGIFSGKFKGSQINFKIWPHFFQNFHFLKDTDSNIWRWYILLKSPCTIQIWIVRGLNFFSDKRGLKIYSGI